MRADRLVAILLLLQRREQVTAAEVAAELEISPRTARRDLVGRDLVALLQHQQNGHKAVSTHVPKYLINVARN